MPTMTLPSKDERIGSGRQALRELLDAKDPELAKAFNNLDKEQLAIGKLFGKLLSTGFGNAQVDAAFNWWELEHNNGEVLNYARKNTLLVQAIAHLVQMTGEDGYRTLRKVFVTLNQS